MDKSRNPSGADGAADPIARSEPVILLGRGGSGTRLLAQLALSTGMFVGNKLNTSHDSVEWVETVYDLAIEAVTEGVASGSARPLGPVRKLSNRLLRE
jgi:hypothetical protein